MKLTVNIDETVLSGITTGAIGKIPDDELHTIVVDAIKAYLSKPDVIRDGTIYYRS